MIEGSIESIFSEDPTILRALEIKKKAVLLDKIIEKMIALKGEKGDSPSKEELLSLIIPLIPEPIHGKDGYTPVKGVDYFDGKDGEDGTTPTEEDILALIKPLIPKPEAPIHTTKTIKEEFALTEDVVKEIIKIMHKLPEKDKLELSKGVRNANSFIYKGTKYKIEELMHGAGTTGTSTNVVTQYDLQTKNASGSDVVVPLSQLTNFSTLTNIVAAYRNQIPQTNGITCTITATDVTFYNADVSETFSITYVYS